MIRPSRSVTYRAPGKSSRISSAGPVLLVTAATAACTSSSGLNAECIDTGVVKRGSRRAIWPRREFSAELAGKLCASRRAAWPDRAIVFGFGHAVETVGQAEKSLAVDDRDAIALALDETLGFEFVQRQRDTLAPHAQQKGQELMCHRQVTRLEPVLPHQQPARQPLAQPASAVGPRRP